ncbi:MAG TPA: right-handed parallel beta-helix repeat-containing protein, partial [Blastocatellia bacterium]|nr:right-handed parallel beta-helix repeat-containing protein [Blastocatellia bacterium]
MKSKSGLVKLISLAARRTTDIYRDQIKRTTRLAMGLALFGVLSVTQASAGASTRTFVSGIGNDNNPCSPEAPCRTFAHAITQTDAGGEIIVMDSAEYGTVAIDRNVTIEAPKGIYAAVNVAQQGTGITISSPNATRVELRGLRLIAQGADSIGISYNGSGFLYIDNCVVDGFYGFVTSKGVGIAILNAGYIFVKDTTVRNGSTGILTAQGGFGASITLDQVRLEGNNFVGLLLRDKHKATIRNSVVSG